MEGIRVIVGYTYGTGEVALGVKPADGVPDRVGVKVGVSPGIWVVVAEGVSGLVGNAVKVAVGVGVDNSLALASFRRARVVKGLRE